MVESLQEAKNLDIFAFLCAKVVKFCMLRSRSTGVISLEVFKGIISIYAYRGLILIDIYICLQEGISLQFKGGKQYIY